MSNQQALLKLTQLQRLTLRVVVLCSSYGPLGVPTWRVQQKITRALNPNRYTWPKKYVKTAAILKSLERRGFLFSRTGERDPETLYWSLGPMTDLMQDMGDWPP
jgi:hypothetical protein